MWYLFFPTSSTHFLTSFSISIERKRMIKGTTSKWKMENPFLDVLLRYHLLSCPFKSSLSLVHSLCIHFVIVFTVILPWIKMGWRWGGWNKWFLISKINFHKKKSEMMGGRDKRWWEAFNEYKNRVNVIDVKRISSNGLFNLLFTKLKKKFYYIPM